MSLPLKTTRYFALARLSIHEVSQGPAVVSARASSWSRAMVAAARVRLVRKSRRLGMDVGVEGLSTCAPTIGQAAGEVKQMRLERQAVRCTTDSQWIGKAAVRRTRG